MNPFIFRHDAVFVNADDARYENGLLSRQKGQEGQKGKQKLYVLYVPYVLNVL